MSYRWSLLSDSRFRVPSLFRILSHSFLQYADEPHRRLATCANQKLNIKEKENCSSPEVWQEWRWIPLHFKMEALMFDSTILLKMQSKHVAHFSKAAVLFCVICNSWLRGCDVEETGNSELQFCWKGLVAVVDYSFISTTSLTNSRTK